jgi:hypothetical protein
MNQPPQELQLALVARNTGPRESDPRAGVGGPRIPISHTALWRWPFAARVDYLVCATTATAALTAIHPR